MNTCYFEYLYTYPFPDIYLPYRSASIFSSLSAYSKFAGFCPW